MNLKSHPGYGLIPKFSPKSIPDWGVEYVHIGVDVVEDDFENVLKLKFEDDKYLMSTSGKHSYQNFILDVPFDKREVGTAQIPLAVINVNKGKNNKESHNKARLWTINVEKGTISPTHSPHLVLGIRPGDVLPPLRNREADMEPVPTAPNYVTPVVQPIAPTLLQPSFSTSNLTRVETIGSKTWHEYRDYATAVGGRLPTSSELRNANVTTEHDYWVPIMYSHGDSETGRRDGVRSDNENVWCNIGPRRYVTEFPVWGLDNNDYVWAKDHFYILKDGSTTRIHSENNKICSKCNTSNSQIANYCMNCGNKLDASDPAADGSFIPYN